MKALTFREPWVSSTVEKLLKLPASTRRAIIRALERSVQPKGNGKDSRTSQDDEKDRLFWSSFGSWKGDGTADELIEKIRKARTFNRVREKL